jgi:uncharacterized protein
MEEKAEFTLDSIPKKSVCVHTLKRGDEYLLFNDTTLTCVQGNKDVVDLVTMCDGTCSAQELCDRIGDSDTVFEVLTELWNNCILIHEKEDDFYSPFVPRAIDINSICIYPTMDCNFECTYCLPDAGSANKKEYITMATVKKAFQYMLEHTSSQRFHILFFGGEPLLGFDIVKDVVKYVEELSSLNGFRFVFKIVTNGSLITPEVAEFFKNHHFSVSVSLDGPEPLHNQCRVYSHGKGTYRQVVKGIHWLKKAKIPFGCVSVVTSHNVDFIPEIVEHNTELGGSGTHLDIIYEAGRATGTIAQPDLKKMAEKMIRTLDMAGKRGPEKIRISDLFGITAMLKNGVRRPSFCGSCGRNLVVLPSGDIHVCLGAPPKELCVGNIHDPDFDMETSPAVTMFLERAVDNLEECKSCAWRYICGGGCPYLAYVQHGSIFKKSMCDLLSTLCEEVVWRIANEEPIHLGYQTFIPQPEKDKISRGI